MMRKSNLINGQKPEFGNLEQIKVLQKAERQISDEKEYKQMRRGMDPLEKAIDNEMNVGWTFYFIDNLTKKATEKLSGRSPLDIMIDKLSGYEQGVIKGFLIELKKAYGRLIKDLKLCGKDEDVVKYSGLLERIKSDLTINFGKVKAVKILD